MITRCCVQQLKFETNKHRVCGDGKKVSKRAIILLFLTWGMAWCGAAAMARDAHLWANKRGKQKKIAEKKNSSTTQRSISFVVRLLLLLVALPRTLIDTAEERWVCSSWGGDRRRRRTLLCFLRAYSLTRARTLSRIFTSERQFSLWPISHARSLSKPQNVLISNKI